MRFESASRAISRRTGSKQERITASGGVVDDQIDTGRLFESADIPSLSADDPALHLVGRQIDNRDRAFDHVFRGDPLDRHRDDPAGLFLGLLDGFVLDLLDQVRRIDARVILHRPQELRLGLFDREPGDLFEPHALFSDGGCKLLLLSHQTPFAFADLTLQGRRGALAFLEDTFPLTEFGVLLAEL